MTDRLLQYAQLTRLDRPVGTLLLLWPVLWALWLSADGRPDPLVFSVFVLGVFFMRSAGCVINDLADADVDPHVKRTTDRPLAAGRVRKSEAWVLFFVLLAVSFALVLTMNLKTIFLSVIAAVVAMTYPLMKRFTHFPQVYLGIAFTWGVPMVYAAHLNKVPTEAWWLFAAGMCWVVAYDTFYAMVDRDDDLKIGVKSTAVLFAEYDRLIIGVFQVAVLALLCVVGVMLGLSFWYYLGVGAAGLFAVYQQYITRARQRDACFKAFLNNNWFGLMVFCGILLHYTFAASAV